MHFLKICRFPGTFSATAATAARDNILANCFIFYKGCPFTTKLKISYGGLGIFFFIGLEVKRGSSEGYDFLPLEKTS